MLKVSNHFLTRSALAASTLVLSLYTVMRRDTGGFGIILALVTFVLALVVTLARDFYLPFLGPAALPAGLVTEEKEPLGATKDVKITVPEEGTSIVYWASEPIQGSDSSGRGPREAYGKGKNAGVAAIDRGTRTAVVRVRPPGEYTVFMGKKTLRPHVHYRIVRGNGLVSRVYTAYVSA